MNPRLVALAILILVLGYLSLLIFLPFSTYLLAAMLLAFMLHPLHRRLAPHIGRRPSSFTLVVFAVAATLTPLVVITYLLVETIEDISEGLDQVVLFQQIEELIVNFTGIDVDLATEIEQAMTRFADMALGELTGLIAQAFHFVIGAMLLVFVLYYLILDGSTLVGWIIDVTPLDRDIQQELLEEANVITWAVLKSHLLVAIIEGVLVGIAFFIAGVPNPAFWTVIMIFLSILPIVGVSLIWAPAVIFLVYIGSFPAAIFLFAYGAVVINLDNYFRAILVDRGSDLHPAVVLVGVLGGLYVFGILGLFIGPIVLAIFKATVNVFGRRYPFDSMRPIA